MRKILVRVTAFFRKRRKKASLVWMPFPADLIVGMLIEKYSDAVVVQVDPTVYRNGEPTGDRGSRWCFVVAIEEVAAMIRAALALSSSNGPLKTWERIADFPPPHANAGSRKFPCFYARGTAEVVARQLQKSVPGIEISSEL